MEKKIAKKIHKVRSLFYVSKKINKIDNSPCKINFPSVQCGSRCLLLRSKASTPKLQFAELLYKPIFFLLCKSFSSVKLH